VDRVNKSVWENMKCIGPSLELEDNVFDNDTFYMSPSNMTKAISIEIENHMNIHCGRRHSCIMLDYHLKIIDQVLYLGSSWHAPLRCTMKYVEKYKKNLSCKKIPCSMHCCPDKYSHSWKCSMKVFLEMFLSFVLYRLGNQTLFFHAKILFKFSASEPLIMFGNH
jgi:hypothetical protein